MALSRRSTALRWVVSHVVFFLAGGGMVISFAVGAPTILLMSLGLLVAVSALSLNLGSMASSGGEREALSPYSYRRQERMWTEECGRLGLSRRWALVAWRSLLTFFVISGLASFLIWALSE